jgi:hypothetical protein
MDDEKKQEIELYDLQQTAEAIEKLSTDPKAFAQAYEAFIAGDAAKFGAALGKVGIEDRCRWVCRFFCRKRCVGVCRKFCPKPATGEVNAEEILGFAKAVGPLLRDPAFAKRLCEVIRSGNVEAWNQEIERNKLQQYCYQLCVILCAECCEKHCHKVCPPDPLITRVGSIPVTQINGLGYGSGPSIPNFYVPSDNPAAGVGDHPFGGSVWLMGIFNMPTAKEYLVEVSNAPLGPYTPIMAGLQDGYDNVPPQAPAPPWWPGPPPPPNVPPPLGSPPPWLWGRKRSQSTGADPGWYQVNELDDSDGGRLATGEKTLLMWQSPLPDGVYYLRLRVRDAAMNTRVSSPQVVRLDNTGPFPLPRPTISLQLKKPDGTLVPLKCGKVRKGDGLILITIQAFDPNMSSVAVTARGNSGLSVPVVDITATPLSRTYNGNIADQGYQVPTSFLWDPWSDPNIVPCCYLVYVEISDRTIINNSWSGGHYNAGWEAIEIGI